MSTGEGSGYPLLLELSRTLGKIVGLALRRSRNRRGGGEINVSIILDNA